MPNNIEMQTRFFATISILLLFFVSDARAYESSPKYEMRAVWVTTIGGLDWPHSYAQSSRSIEKQQKELRRLLDDYQKVGINTVLLQTRIRGTVIYPSAMEPWDGCLSGFPGKSAGYDALKFAVDECHRRGMELHAWVVTIPVGRWEKLGCQSLRKRYPGLIRRIGTDGYMNPENAKTATYLADMCEEIVRNYDVDGVHLDYIRYPETWKLRVSGDQGRHNITTIVRAIHDRVKALKPWVKMSCSPIGKFDDLSRYWSHGWNAYSKVCQDAQGWLREGLMDALFPMMYFRENQFFPFAIDWAEQSEGRMVAPGLGIYFLDPKEGNWKLDDVKRQMEVLRMYGMGHAYFRGRFLTDNVQGIYDYAGHFDSYLALVPPMTWQSRELPATPTMLTVGQNGLRWQGTTPYYNIYSSRTWPVDTEDAANLIAMRQQGDRLTVPTENRYFAVTGMNRYGCESKALQSVKEEAAVPSSLLLLPCDGRQLRLPAKGSMLDADLLLIESLQGCMVCTRPYQGRFLDVSLVPEGCYVLKSLGAKGVAHRLGFFMIRRK